jgi:AraC-like DNA-binding protein
METPFCTTGVNGPALGYDRNHANKAAIGIRKNLSKHYYNKTTMESVYTLPVKNMVCQRCILIVENILGSLHIQGAEVALGKIRFPQQLESSRQKQLAERLLSVGLEVIESRMNQLIENVKQGVRDYLALGLDAQQYKLSSFVASKLTYDYGYLSDLFSKVEGITIERYFMLQRLEKVKELLTYDQLSLSEIVYETGFSSAHHLSAQFKKLAGLTPSQYKQRGQMERKSLDLIGA